ncbi:TPA: sensor histidine kinase [Yersinia enterocolitica]|uniref:histidine kinase n=1 Tax=Yersinia enterocolitica serotype O:8 / biotype 1B (strain NCTC 13174 / 8081) TaxID=393305 RepID=A1JNJ9_YERE8|nr:ATP-binding protein [Yersinia enterocolitica]AJJ25153.1 histidine kinase-, DNA gyrase B-, and HSP90-like ATPase family protein [Yersinia enterocolitica]ELI8043458.1 ATP-binding protein [Yersinia enterocolitica]ELI8441106.1 ATP-binding protein [Yersinia enterocolitica]ELW8974557.1 ATP-binding protein [Yersinia enterocolitica]CAL11758.1 putative prophage encoded two-component system histidine kinase [Yersinia enterocolitica subsp. enterocolitica 8081]
MSQIENNSYHFKTHSDLKNIIGQDLINDDNIAIIELVKNGIDANAENIKVTFSEKKKSIIVFDNGHGMSLSDLENKWLNIAYSEKKSIKIKNRLLAGNKGVGRFACDRLGQKLDLFTQKNNNSILHLSLNWKSFEGLEEHNSVIQAVDISINETTIEYVEENTGFNINDNGTILLITDLRQSWDRDKLLSLKRHLQSFVNPIAAFDNSIVNIELISLDELKDDSTLDEHLKINGIIENTVFEKLKFNTTYIESKINDTGEILTTELFHDGVRIYKIVEKNTLFDKIKNISVVLHFMNPYKKAYFKRQTGLTVVEFGSVFLFINGYRVSPYGDRDNDWLQLNSRKAQGQTRYFGNRDLLGVINIIDNENNFRIVSNREGVAKNEPFTQLTKKPDGLIIKQISRLEKFVTEGLSWDQVPESTRKLLSSGIIPGDASMPEGEVYSESTQSKKRRIALDLFKIVDASPQTTLSLDISSEVLDSLAQEKEESVSAILKRFNAYEGNVVGHDVKLALNKVQEEFEKQKMALTKASKTVAIKERHVTKLIEVARNLSHDNKKLENEVKTQQTEVLFSRLTSSTDYDQLLLLHHQSKIQAEIVKGFLDKALNILQSTGEKDKIFDLMEKALINTRKIITVNNFATKANFKMHTENLSADIATFIQQYAENVASENSAQNMNVNVKRHFDSPFVVKFKPIEIAIIFDNLANNSTRAKAKNFNIELMLASENELKIIISDDGIGLNNSITPPSAIFEKGVTTTTGSGLGLYHVKQTIEKLNGTIDLSEDISSGFGLIMRIFK